MEVTIIFFSIIFGSLFFQDENTKVVLAENDKSKNSIIVKTQNSKTTLDKPYQYLDISKKSKKPKIKKMSKDEFNKRFKEIIKNEPMKPKSILLYFESGGSNLTEESIKNIDLIHKEIGKRKTADLNIIGHSDTKGNDEFNIKLSLKRAMIVKDLISKENLKVNSIKVDSYGENDLLIKTKDNVSEPKNRRVEVVIK